MRFSPGEKVLQIQTQINRFEGPQAFKSSHVLVGRQSRRANEWTQVPLSGW